MNKEEVCVFIESESHLQQARELLERYGEKIFRLFFILTSNDHDYLFFDDNYGWSLSYMDKKRDTLITLTDLEQILKQQ